MDCFNEVLIFKQNFFGKRFNLKLKNDQKNQKSFKILKKKIFTNVFNFF